MSVPIRVLLVDDEPIFLEAVQALLDLDERITVVGTSADAEHALALARSRQPDVALVDVRLPRTDGLELTRRLLEQDAELKVIALTGLRDGGTPEAAVAAGASGYLVKGGLHEEIADTIVAVSGQSSQAGA